MVRSIDCPNPLLRCLSPERHLPSPSIAPEGSSHFKVQRNSHGLVRTCTANVTASLTAGPATEKSLTLILPRFQVRLRLH